MRLLGCTARAAPFLFRDLRARWKMNNVFRDAHNTSRRVCMQFFCALSSAGVRSLYFSKEINQLEMTAACMQDSVCVYFFIASRRENYYHIRGGAQLNSNEKRAANFAKLSTWAAVYLHFSLFVLIATRQIQLCS